MSLRVRLFLILGGLVILLIAAEWWLVRSLTQNLSTEMGRVAIYVGHSVANVLSMDEEPVGEEEIRKIRKDVHIVPHETVEHDHTMSIEATDPVQKPVYVFRRKIQTGGEEAEGVTEEHTEIQEVRIHLDASDHDSAAAGYVRLKGAHLEESIPVPRMGLNKALDEFSSTLFLGTFGILGLGLVLSGLVAYRVAAPMRELGKAARNVGQGALGTQVPVSSSGEVGAAIRSFNHMSQRLKELDEDARALRERQHLSELGEVARGMAHSLRNPLNALGLSMEELAAKLPPHEKPEELVESLRRQIRRIDQSIRSFLFLTSDITNGTDPIDVLLLLQDVVLEALQDSRGRVHIDVETNEPLPKISGVQPEMRATVHALLMNAVEASPDGARVTVSARSIGIDRVQIDIEDEGPGLPPEVRERLFTPHVTTKATGTGMGLYLTHRIVTSHYGGSLSIEDKKPLGTRASVEITHRRSVTNG